MSKLELVGDDNTSDKKDDYAPNVEAAVMNGVAQEIGQITEEKGFREDWHDAEFLEAVATAMEAPTALLNGDVPLQLRRIANVLRTNVIGMKLMLTVSELSEGLESLRDTGYEGHMTGDGNLGEELADAKIRIDDLAEMIRVAIGDETMKKVQKNRSRPHKHGRQI